MTEGFTDLGELMEAAVLAKGLDPYETPKDVAHKILRYELQVIKWQQLR